MALIVRGSAPASVFQLAGTDENSATYGLGWVLEKSLALRRALVHFLLGEELDVTDAVMWLQKHGEDGGYTDLEIHAGQEFHLFIEAKKGWQVPRHEQLLKYRPRLTASGARRQRIVSLSSAPAAFIANNFPAAMDGVKVVHLSWRDVQRMATAARKEASTLEEKSWLQQLVLHMEEFVAMEKSTDNNVFVVSLRDAPMLDGGSHTWVDVVNKDRGYFHPVGKTWPAQPPNYVGFRYHGKLQSVHHIDSFKIVLDVSTENPMWPKTEDDHFVYRLGPPMRPAAEVKSGDIRNRRLRCAIDTLLSGAFKTLTDASEETKRRLADGE